MQSQNSVRRNKTPQRLFALALAIYLFNFSVDPKDVGSIYEAENLSVNDIESVAELLTEEVLGLEDLINEIDEADTSDKSLNISVAFVLFPGSTSINLSARSYAAIPYPLAKVVHPRALIADVASPPPRHT